MHHVSLLQVAFDDKTGNAQLITYFCINYSDVTLNSNEREL